MYFIELLNSHRPLYQSDFYQSATNLIRIGKYVEICADVDDVVDNLLICCGTIFYELSYVVDNRRAQGASYNVLLIFGRRKFDQFNYFWGRRSL